MTLTKQDSFIKSVTDLPNTPSPDYTPTEIKSYFQNPADELAATHNKLVDELTSETGAGELGALDEDGFTLTSVQERLDKTSSGFKSHKEAETMDHPDKSVKESKLDNDSVSERTIQNGAVTVSKLDPAILSQPATQFGQQAKFEQIDEQLADIATVADWIDARNYGVVADGATDNTQSLQNAINAAISKQVPLKLPSGSIWVFNTIHINTPQVRIVGTYGANSTGAANGTTISFKSPSTGALFQLGTDDELAWDSSSDYNGVQGFMLEHIRLVAGVQNTPLDNGSGNYMAGSYAIRDWRGGSLVLNDVFIVGFEYGIWGIKSDYNTFNTCYIYGCHKGLYLGPRSDQNTIIHLSTNNNDLAIWIDQASHTRFYGCQFVVDGSPTQNPIKIGSQWSKGATGTLFEGCWFERYSGGSAITAFVDVGVGDTVTTYDITFRDCMIHTNIQGNVNGYAKYFCQVGKARRVNIDNPLSGMNNDISNLLKIIHSVGSGSPDIFMKVHYDYISLVYDTDGTSTPNISVYSYGVGQIAMHTQNSRFFVNCFNNPLRSYQLTTEYGTKSFAVDFPNSGDGNTTRFLLNKRYTQGTASPTTNSWDVGDYIQNQNPSVQGSSGSQYIIRGWVCTVAGTPGTWVQDRGYTGT